MKKNNTAAVVVGLAAARAESRKILDALERQEDPKIVEAVHAGEKCKAPGCSEPARAKGYCVKDYQRARRKRDGQGRAKPGSEARELPKGTAVEVKCSITRDELAEVDRLRGNVSRNQWIRAAIRLRLDVTRTAKEAES